VVFEADYDEIELKKYNYDAITVTSSSLNFPNLSNPPPPPIKISGYASE